MNSEEKNCNDRRKLNGIWNFFVGINLWKFLMDGLILAAVTGTFSALWTQNADIACLKMGVGDMRISQEKRDVTLDRMSGEINKINNNIDKISFKLDFLQNQVQTKTRVSLKIDSITSYVTSNLKKRLGE